MNDITILRKQHGFTQERFAREIGVSINTVRKWEYGTIPSPLAAEKLKQFIKKYGVMPVNQELTTK
jgi:DNA-binding transcriptional regulator YiaG